MSSKKNPLSRKDDIVVQELEGEVLIYDLRANKAFCLNETSALIWQACDGSKDIPQIREFVSNRLNSEANEDLIWLALDQLKKEKLLASVPDSDGRFAGISRRDVMKRVAVGTMIAVPIVAGLVAPHAYAAGSSCGTLCMCTNSSPVGTICVSGDCTAGMNPCTRCQVTAATNPSTGVCVV